MSEEIEEYKDANVVVRNNDNVLEGPSSKLKMQPKSKQNNQSKYMNYRRRAFNKLMRLEEEKAMLKDADTTSLSESEKGRRNGRLNALEMKIKFIEIKENKRLYSRSRRPIKVAKGVFNKIKSFCGWVTNKFREHYINKNSEFMNDNLESLAGMSDQINDYVEQGFSGTENSVNKSEELNENNTPVVDTENSINNGTEIEKDSSSSDLALNEDLYRLKKDEIVQDGVVFDKPEEKVGIDVAPVVTPVTNEIDQINIPDIENEKDAVSKESENTSLMEVPSLPEEFNNIFETSNNKEDEIVKDIPKVEEKQETELELPISRTPVVVEEKINNQEEKREESILDSMTADNGKIDYLATQRVLSEIEKKYDNVELLELSKQLAQALNENLMEKQNSGIIKEQRQVAEETQQAVNREYEESENQLKNTMYSVLENVQSSTKQIEATNQEERAIVDSIKQDVETKRQMTNANRTYISTVGEFNSYKSENGSEASNSRGGK